MNLHTTIVSMLSLIKITYVFRVALLLARRSIPKKTQATINRILEKCKTIRYHSPSNIIAFTSVLKCIKTITINKIV